MIAKTKAKRTAANKKPAKQQETLGDLVSKYFLPFAVAITSAIFYFTGWVYISHWYGYFGIDATQISMSVQNILVNGMPGVIALITTLIIAAILVIIWKQIILGQSITLEELPHILIGGYVVAAIISMVAVFSTQLHIPVTLEMGMSWVALFVIWFVVNMLVSFKNDSVALISRFRFDKGISVTAAIRLRIIIDGLLKGDLNLFKTAFASEKNKKFISQSETIRQMQIAKIKRETESVNNIVTQSRPIWLTSLLLLYFLVAISTSAILGEWDAVRGGRLMVGDWRIPEVSIFSSERIPSLIAVEKIDNGVFEYSPLGLLSNDDKVYYLVEWKTTKYYQQKPKIYIIPRLDNLILNFIVSPYANPNVLPLPTMTIMPTASSSISTTPTP